MLSSNADRTIKVTVSGIPELKRALRGLSADMRRKVIRSALRKGAAVIQERAKALAPVLSKPAPFRRPGTVRKRITVRASKFARQAGNVGVFINVRPIRGSAQVRRYGRASAHNPNDPFYWRFLEFGTKKMAARPFLAPAAVGTFARAVAVFAKEAGPAIQKLNDKRR